MIGDSSSIGVSFVLALFGAGCFTRMLYLWFFRPPRMRVPPAATVGSLGAEPGVRIRLRGATNTTRRLGRYLRSRAGRAPDEIRDRWLGRLVVYGTGAMAISPVLALLVVAASLAAPVLELRRQLRRNESEIHESLAETIDLFVVALAGGHNISSAVRTISQWVDGSMGAGLRWCTDQVALGRPLADALEELVERVAPAVRPLTAALVANERYGAPISQTLVTIATEARSDRRRCAEAAARRLPVSLLFPLVVCVLPAFLLLTVVPVLAQSLDSFVS